MPFKSKDQWRKFFAMAERGEISKEKAKQWAKETKTPFSELPENLPEKEKGASSWLEDAYARGLQKAVKEASEKVGGAGESWLLKKLFNYGAPAAVGAALSDPGNELEGATLGLGGALLGRVLGKEALKRGLFSTDELVKIPKFTNQRVLGKALEKGDDLAIQYQKYLNRIPAAKNLGTVAGTAGAGYGIHKLMNEQPPRPLGFDLQPSAYDMGTHYTGLTPY